jgi:hypothetical protein
MAQSGARVHHIVPAGWHCNYYNSDILGAAGRQDNPPPGKHFGQRLRKPPVPGIKCAENGSINVQTIAAGREMRGKRGDFLLCGRNRIGALLRMTSNWK